MRPHRNGLLAVVFQGSIHTFVMVLSDLNFSVLGKLGQRCKVRSGKLMECVSGSNPLQDSSKTLLIITVELAF